MSRHPWMLSPLASRLVGGRPVMTRDQLLAISQRVLRMTTVDVVEIRMVHTARVVTRFANDHVLSSDDGDTLWIQVGTAAGGPPFFTVRTNQLDDHVLLAGIQQCETLLRAGGSYQPDSGMKHEATQQDIPIPVHLWHEPTIQAMTTVRGTVIPELLSAVRREGLHAAGFLGLMARAEASVSKENGITFFSEETDSEVTVTARGRDGVSSGWAGQAARDWSTINYAKVAQQAIEIAKRGVNPVAIEPGRRTAILTPAAVVQILRYLAKEFDAGETDQGRTALSKAPPPRGGNKLRQRIFDSRLTMSSDPADPAGGYRPFFDSQRVVATPAMTWVKEGILANMAYDVTYAMMRGKEYAEWPIAFRLSGGPTTLEQMVAQCKEGIYVNRFSDVDLVDLETGLTTGVTRDGCFLVRDGKITKAVKNFRFLDSPFFFLNRIEALGIPERAAFGHTPIGHDEGWFGDWPRPPIIVPPMMVRDFNFSSTVDAV